MELADYILDGLGSAAKDDPCFCAFNPTRKIITEEEFQAVLKRYEERHPSASKADEEAALRFLCGPVKEGKVISGLFPESIGQVDEDEAWASALALLDRLNWMMKAMMEVETLSAEASLELALLQEETALFINQFEPQEI